MLSWVAGPCKCRQMSTTYKQLNPRSENRGFIMLWVRKSVFDIPESISGAMAANTAIAPIARVERANINQLLVEFALV